MEYKAVVGLGFGDEGKGKVVSTLCQQSINKGRKPIVVRYSGGQQAAHTVVFSDWVSHVFSNFGSGTLQGVDTYWSKYCTFDPVGIMNEYDELKSHKKSLGRLIIDPDCPVATLFDKLVNMQVDETNKHGSCGVGVGQTWQREQDHFSITANDLKFPTILRMKMQNLWEYYYKDRIQYLKGGSVISEFMERCHKLMNLIEIRNIDLMGSDEYTEAVFEGSQGLLLDQDFGFFPNVTRSSVGAKNILKLASFFRIEFFLVTRSYQTRHGNGPMTYEDQGDFVNPHESNNSDGFQGKFRTGILDLDLINYGISKDDSLKYCFDNVKGIKVNLVINHMDVPKHFQFAKDGDIINCANKNIFIENVSEGITGAYWIRVLFSNSPFTGELKYYI